MEVAIEYICFICIIVPVIMMTITMTGKARLLIGSMAMGLFISLFSSELSGFILRELKLDDMMYITTTLTPIIEEVLKAIPLMFYAFMVSKDRRTLMSVAFGIGVGFAVLENIVILIRAVMSNPTSVSYLWAFVRGFGSGLMHAVTTMLIGVGLNFIGNKKKLILPGVFGLLAMAATYHAIYNAMVQTDLKYYGFVMPLITYIALTPLIFHKDTDKKGKKKDSGGKEVTG